MMLAAPFVTSDQHRTYLQHSYYFPHLRNHTMSVQQPPQLLQPSFPSHNSPTAPSSHLHASHTSNSHRLQLPESDLHSYVEAHGQSLDGFPNQQQFEELLNEYILSLSPKKRDKALIPRKRYDNILAVLKDPKCTTIESAQFRFWAKKMFRLGLGNDNRDIVCHEGKPVAVREELYGVLTESHGRAQHGGRDKTSAEVRRFYSWVPKELIARFVRHCPSCTLRRSAPLEYPIMTMPPKSPQGYEMMVGSTTYTVSTSAPALSPILRTSNETISSMNGNALTMTSPPMPQLQAIQSGAHTQLLSPNGQEVSVAAYPYATSFPAEGTNNISAVSPLLDHRSVFSSRP